MLQTHHVHPTPHFTAHWPPPAGTQLRLTTHTGTLAPGRTPVHPLLTPYPAIAYMKTLPHSVPGNGYCGYVAGAQPACMPPSVGATVARPWACVRGNCVWSPPPDTHRRTGAGCGAATLSPACRSLPLDADSGGDGWTSMAAPGTTAQVEPA